MTATDTTHAASCTCGNPAEHVIMRRRTADGIDVCLWEDGAITGSLGYRLNGVPLRRPRTAAAIATARRAGRLLLGEVCIHDAADLGELYVAAEAAARGDGLPGTMRRIYRKRQERRALPPLAWKVTSTDRNGQPTERQAMLPRLRWPGLAVFDYCGGPGSNGGRYVLCGLVAGTRDTYQATGLAFTRLADLWAHLSAA